MPLASHFLSPDSPGVQCRALSPGLLLLLLFPKPIAVTEQSVFCLLLPLCNLTSRVFSYTSCHLWVSVGFNRRILPWCRWTCLHLILAASCLFPFSVVSLLGTPQPVNDETWSPSLIAFGPSSHRCWRTLTVRWICAQTPFKELSDSSDFHMNCCFLRLLVVQSSILWVLLNCMDQKAESRLPGSNRHKLLNFLWIAANTAQSLQRILARGYLTINQG